MRVFRMLAAGLILGLVLLPLTASAQGMEIRLIEPMENGVVLGDAITVIFEVSGMRIVPSQVKLEDAGKQPEANRPDEGHLHLMLDLQPIVIWDKSDPYTFTNVPPGEHVLMIEAVNNDHSPRTPPLVLQRHLTVQPGNAAPPAGIAATMPDTAADDLLKTVPGRIALLITALILINLGSIVRQYQKHAQLLPHKE